MPAHVSVNKCMFVFQHNVTSVRKLESKISSRPFKAHVQLLRSVAANAVSNQYTCAFQTVSKRSQLCHYAFLYVHVQLCLCVLSSVICSN